jgi:hypothetical protein
MSWREFRELYNEGPEDHFDDPYEYARYLERCGNKARARAIRRMMEGKEDAENEDRVD